jgi:type 1 glutamine amidotransferase
VANDELYHKIDLKPNAHVLATALDVPKDQGGTGKEEPVIWTVPYGQGRVVMMVLGHDLLAMSQPGFMDAFARGTEWAATGNVAPGYRTLAPPTNLPEPARSH